MGYLTVKLLLRIQIFRVIIQILLRAIKVFLFDTLFFQKLIQIPTTFNDEAK
jgi:hypothetical protein